MSLKQRISNYNQLIPDGEESIQDVSEYIEDQGDKLQVMSLKNTISISKQKQVKVK